MFGIGFGELLVIGVVLLIAVGPRRMPVMLKSLGRAMREFKKATRELRSQTGIDELLAEDDVLRSAKKAPAVLRPVANVQSPHAPAAESLAVAAKAREYPAEGVDVAESSVAPTPKVEA